MYDEIRVELTVPSPRFKIGDFLRIRPDVLLNPRGRFDYIARVEQIKYSGSWSLWDSTKIQLIETKGPMYSAIVQSGYSGSLGVPQVPVRPGTRLLGLSESEDSLELIPDWPWSIISPDTPDNINERTQTWARLMGNLK